MKISDKISEITNFPNARVWVAQTGLSEGIVLRGSIPNEFDRAGNPEIGAVMAELLDEGTRHHGREALRERLLGLGATVNFRTCATRIEFTITCLSSGFEEVMKLLSEMLYEPLFGTTALKAVSTRLIGELTEARFDSRVQARDALTRMLYPVNFPLYRREFGAQLKGLKSATRGGVIAHHKKSLESGAFYLVVAGDISPLRAEKALKKYFTVARSKPPETAFETFLTSPVSTKLKDSFSIITLSDKASVDTFWGAVPGISKLHQDFIPLTIALQILGGGFMSRLMQEIREKRGLTYGVYTRLSGFEGGLSGYWYIWATFAPQVFGEGVAQVERVIREFITAGVTKKEVDAKKERIAGLHKISCSSTEEISSVLLALLTDGRPFSYVDQFLDAVESVSQGDVEAVVHKYFSAGQMARTAAGSINLKGLPLTGKNSPAKL